MTKPSQVKMIKTSCCQYGDLSLVKLQINRIMKLVGGE